MHSPFTKIRYVLTFASSSLEQFLRAIWGAVSWAIVLTLPQIRLNSTLTVCIFFWVDSVLSLKLDEMITKAFFHLFFHGSSYCPSLCQTWAMSATSCKELAAHVPCVVEPKFMCLPHSEVKQTRKSEFGAEDGLLLDQARRTCGFCSKESSMVFREEFLKAKYWMRVAGLWLSSDWLVVTSQGGAPGLLHLALPCSILKGDLVPAGELKDILLHTSLEEELGLCFMATLLFTDCFSFVYTFPYFPN